MTTATDTIAFALRTEDAAWIKRNAEMVDGKNGLVWVRVPAAEVERFDRMGRPWMQAEKDASRAANVARVLAAMGRHGS
jgi:hypothetical protein